MNETAGPRQRHIYGPVPSRRLGRSLGVDLVPYKTCSYNCTYCQLGRTTDLTLARRVQVPVPELLDELEAQLDRTDRPDYIGLAGSGEPTLHSGLGELIAGIKQRTTVPVAVLTNGSLLWQPEVRRELAEADLVLPSLDAGSPAGFQRINRPAPGLAYAQMVEGLCQFSWEFKGSLWLEVFVLGDEPELLEEMTQIAARVATLRIDRVQLNTLARPSATTGVQAADQATLRKIQALFAGPCELIAEFAGPRPYPHLADPELASTIRALLARRPCTVAGIAAGLHVPPNEVLKQLDALRAAGAVQVIRRDGEPFYAGVADHA